MPFNFPSSPSLNQESTQNGRVYKWSGSAWELVATLTDLSTNINNVVPVKDIIAGSGILVC